MYGSRAGGRARGGAGFVGGGRGPRDRPRVPRRSGDGVDAFECSGAAARVVRAPNIAPERVSAVRVRGVRAVRVGPCWPQVSPEPFNRS